MRAAVDVFRPPVTLPTCSGPAPNCLTSGSQFVQQSQRFWGWRSVRPLILLFSATQVSVIAFTALIAHWKILLLQNSLPLYKARLYNNRFLLKLVKIKFCQRFRWQILISLEAANQLCQPAPSKGKGHCIGLFGTCQLWILSHHTSLSACHKKCIAGALEL